MYAGTAGVVITFILVVLRPLVGALSDRISGRAARASEFEARLARLEEEVVAAGDASTAGQRLMELEERLDFTERLLAQQAAVPVPRQEP